MEVIITEYQRKGRVISKHEKEIIAYHEASHALVAFKSMNNAYLGGDASLACFDETAAKIDQAVVKLVKKDHDTAYNIISQHKEKLTEISKFILEKETITGEEYMYILNNQGVDYAGTKIAVDL